MKQTLTLGSDDLPNIKGNIAYLSDIFTKFNKINLQL